MILVRTFVGTLMTTATVLLGLTVGGALGVLVFILIAGGWR